MSLFHFVSFHSRPMETFSIFYKYVHHLKIIPKNISQKTNYTRVVLTTSCSLELLCKRRVQWWNFTLRQDPWALWSLTMMETWGVKVEFQPPWVRWESISHRYNSQQSACLDARFPTRSWLPDLVESSGEISIWEIISWFSIILNGFQCTCLRVPQNRGPLLRHTPVQSQVKTVHFMALSGPLDENIALKF